MQDIELHIEYDSSGESVQDLFDRTEEGFYVPLYQREYSWEEDNINQLFDDLVSGTWELVDNPTSTTFLGTLILTTLGDKKQSIVTGEERAQPTAVQIVIDGQQRISTLALLSIQIVAKLNRLLDRLPRQDPHYSDICNAGIEFIKRLTKVYTIELGKGAEPPEKPKIIRAKEDKWTYDGKDSAYRSPVAHYIATFIRTKCPKKSLNALNSNSGARVRGNVKLIDDWLDAVCNAHDAESNIFDQFPVGASIATEQIQEFVLGFTNDCVKSVVERSETDKSQIDYFATATYQLLLQSNYLLRRCGVNRLQPTQEDWGFDMFQALNATGTPLTVMETFLPQVMQAEQTTGNDWDNTPSREHMDDIQDLFEVTSTNEQKNRRTNELLGTFALCYDGIKIGNKFSGQRRWLSHVYKNKLLTIELKRAFLEKLAQTAKFYYSGWYLEDASIPHHINGLENHDDGELATFLVRYLRDANSKLSAPILARFYGQVLDESSSIDDFIDSVKACAAFFTIWRSANSTLGLDDIYRKFFKGSEAPVSVRKHHWKAHPRRVTVSDLKRYFLDVLRNKGITNQEKWIADSERFLLYSELKTVCRFVLFLAAHDRVADETELGLTTAGTDGSCIMLSHQRWLAEDHKSVEHVAPQNPPQGHMWDSDIYDDNLVHQVGNLLLLPLDLNNLVDNKEWAVKYLYYCHAGERNQGNIDGLKDAAQNRGIVLKKKATNALLKIKYSCAVEPILGLRDSGKWDAKFIASRTRQIKEIAWDTLFPWLSE